MPIDRELDLAYRATTYRVYGDAGNTPIDIRIGEVTFRLDALLGDHSHTWAFVTACNPRSHFLSADQNDTRHAELMRMVHARGWRSYQGVGLPDNTEWQPEQSLLVVDISREDAVEIGTRFGQNAIVAGQSGRPAELVYCA